MEHRILVVDDEEPILFAMREYFESQGYHVDCARELEEAQALLANVGYAAVVADLRLTGVRGTEGLDIVACVRERCPSTCVVLLTAYGSDTIEEEARRRGADAFLRKPKPLSEVVQLLMSLIEARS